MLNNTHTSVMLAESIGALAVQPGGHYIDATFGRGGHTQAIIQKGGRVIAFDWDAVAIAAGTDRFSAEIAAGALQLIHEPFSQILSVIQKQDTKIMGILFDFGTSVEQLTSSERGFSVLGTGLLDMRMDTRLGVKALDLLAVLPEKQLAQLFRDFGGEQEAGSIAKAIKRSPQPITTANELSELVRRTKRFKGGHLHPATKVFQALRIAVNSELDEIAQALAGALQVVSAGSKIVTIAFHESEDRIAKDAFRQWENAGKGTQLTKKPLIPSEEEITQNPRSRSAKLRVFEKSEGNL